MFNLCSSATSTIGKLGYSNSFLYFLIIHGCSRAGGRAVNLGGQAFIRGGQSLKISTKGAVFIRVSMLIEGAKHVEWRARPPGAGHGCLERPLSPVRSSTLMRSVDFSRSVSRLSFIQASEVKGFLVLCNKLQQTDRVYS